jgi:hypothetical protein
MQFLLHFLSLEAVLFITFSFLVNFSKETWCQPHHQQKVLGFKAILLTF